MYFILHYFSHNRHRHDSFESREEAEDFAKDNADGIYEISEIDDDFDTTNEIPIF